MFPKETRILIVDDMKTMRMVVKKTLSGFGFSDIVEADDGQTALPELEKAFTEGRPFRLIISDWSMPKLNGLEFLKKVRAHAKASQTPFVLLTAESDAAQIKEAIAAGVSNYITKPFTPDTLREKLEKVYQATQTQKKSA